jgi:aspartyl-tRNA(Asn)/glutamyl-tRNA(Gln) amidotransferase subunit A
MPPPRPTIAEAAAALRAGRTSALELTEACLSRIRAENGALGAFIHVMEDQALAQAREADAAFARGEVAGPLQGVPLSLKDLIDVEGVPTTAASNVRRGHVAAAHAPVTARLLAERAVLVGKCNLHEYAFGTTSEDSAYGPARHPLDPSRSPGGSSGGSASAIVAGMCCGSIGTDTGGSIRIPAAVCGLVGLKGTIGDVPTDGVVPLSPTLDHVGPLARTVEDAGLLFETLTGTPVWPGWEMNAPSIPDLKVAVLSGYFLELLDDEVRARFEAFVDRLRRAGARVESVEIPHAAEIASIYLPIVLGEAAAYHGPLLERQGDDYTRPVRLRLELGRYVPAEDYLRARQGRRVLRAEFDAALDTRDVLLLPTVTIPAPAIGQATVRLGERDEPVRNAMLRLTQPFNLSGHPAVTLPVAPTRAGLPVGIQLVGHRHRTARLLHWARVCEERAAG